jgi:hypothetical protein
LFGLFPTVIASLQGRHVATTFPPAGMQYVC